MNLPSRNAAAFQQNRHFQVYEGGSSSNISAFGRLEVPYNKSDWVRELSSRFEEVMQLELGWDGYQGVPVSFANASFAANLLEALFNNELPPPSLVPGSDGTLQLEWHINGYDLEIDILGTSNVAVSRYSYATDTVEEIDLQDDFSVLEDWIDELAQGHQSPELAMA